VVDSSGQTVAEKYRRFLCRRQSFRLQRGARKSKDAVSNGDYSDVRASASHVANGWRIEFVVERNLYNNVVRIEVVKPPPTEAAALAAVV